MCAAILSRKLSLPRDAQSVLKLPSHPTGLDKVSPKQLHATANLALQLWFPLVLGGGSDDSVARGSQPLADLGSVADEVLEVLVGQFATSAHFLIDTGRLSKLPENSWAQAPLRSSIDLLKGARDGPQDSTRALQAFLGTYLLTLGTLPIIRRDRPGQPQDMTDAFDAVGHVGLQLMLLFDGLAEPQRQMAEQLKYLIVRSFQCAYKERFLLRSSEVPSGPFSQIRPSDLESLAKRSPKLIQSLGKRLESRYEVQLALVMQSMGFLVVSTRVGESTVDLHCMSPRPDPFTFLLEAKTSTKPYNLPTSDQRALRSYVRDAVTRVAPFGPPKFVLIVGQEPSRSLDRRLGEAESTVGIPVRYCRATDLGVLREQLLDGPDHRDFSDSILSSARLIPQQVFNKLIARSKELRQAHTTYVRTLLGLIDDP